jgi:hypothetical protein
MNLNAMYGRTTVRPVVDTAATNAFSTIFVGRCAVIASPSGRQDAPWCVRTLRRRSFNTPSYIASFRLLLLGRRLRPSLSSFSVVLLFWVKHQDNSLQTSGSFTQNVLMFYQKRPHVLSKTYGRFFEG